MRPARIALGLLLAALLAPANAAALHELPVRLTDEGVRIAAPLPLVGHTLRDVGDVLDPPRAAAAQAEPPAVQPAAATTTPAPDAALAPWAIPILAALFVLLLVASVAALLVRRARREAADLRARLALARMCADASVTRATHLAETNARLREALRGA